MFRNEYTLAVDLKRKMTSVVPTFVQYDSAILYFDIYDDGKKYDLTDFTSAKVTHKRPDGTIVSGDATIEGLGNKKLVKYTYQGSEMDYEGNVETMLTLNSGTKKVTIRPFKVVIITDLLSEQFTPANPEVGGLQTLVAQVEALVSKVNTAATNATTQANYAKSEGDKAKAVVTDSAEAIESIRITKEQMEDLKVQLQQTKIDSDVVKNATQATNVATKLVKEETELVKTQTEQARLAAIYETDNTKIATNNANTAASKADLATLSTQEAIRDWSFKEAYDVSKTYKKHNVVSHNGSSYIALKDNTGETPIGDASDLTWKTLARKGRDGEGTITLHKDAFASIAGQRRYTLSEMYDTLQNRIYLIVGGVIQTSPENFMESSNQSITLNEDIGAGVEIIAIYFGEAPAIKGDLQTQITSLSAIMDFLDIEVLRSAAGNANLEAANAKSKAILADTAATAARSEIASLSGLKDDVKQAETDAISATELADSAANVAREFKNTGVFDIDVGYKKNNIVTYEGSSYIALQDAKFKEITNQSFWTALAEKGEKGEKGDGLNIIGSLDNALLLPPTGKAGDAYVITGDLYTWTGSVWENVGRIKGEKGDSGKDGKDAETVGTPTDVFIATASQTLFTLSQPYDMSRDRLEVFIGGSIQRIGVDYEETSSTSFTVKEPVPEGVAVIVNYYSRAIVLDEGISVAVNKNSTDIAEQKSKTDTLIESFETTLVGFTNIESYGAIGDGVTDCTEEIQLAIDSCPQGGTVFIPLGSFVHSGLRVPANYINFLGVGRMGSRLINISSNSAIVIETLSERGTFQNLAILGNGDSIYGTDATSGHGIEFSAISVSWNFVDVSIRGHGGDGFHGGTKGFVNNINIVNSDIDFNKGSGVYFVATAGEHQINAIYINGNNISNNGGSGVTVWGNNINIVGNTIQGNRRYGFEVNSDTVLGNGALLCDMISIERNYSEANQLGLLYMKVDKTVNEDITTYKYISALYFGQNFGIENNLVPEAKALVCMEKGEGVSNLLQGAIKVFTFDGNSIGSPLVPTIDAGNLLDGYSEIRATETLHGEEFVNTGLAKVILRKKTKVLNSYHLAKGVEFPNPMTGISEIITENKDVYYPIDMGDAAGIHTIGIPFVSDYLDFVVIFKFFGRDHGSTEEYELLTQLWALPSHLLNGVLKRSFEEPFSFRGKTDIMLQIAIVPNEGGTGMTIGNPYIVFN